MKRGERSVEGPAGKQEFFWEKLRRSVGKRGGHTTPVASLWRINELGGVSAHHLGGGGGGGGGSEQVHDIRNFIEDNSPCRSISSRKLAAAFWELHHYTLPLDNIHYGVSVPPLNHCRRRRRRRRRRQQEPPFKEKGGLGLLDHPPSSSDLPESSSNLMRRVVKSLTQHHRSIEKSTHAIRTVSPPSYGSSMEISPYNPAVTPSSLIKLKGRNGEASYCLRTSTELLKVLNRIWSLEEQHVPNISLIKSLKKQLDHARSWTQKLVREQQADRHKMDELMKHIAEDRLLRKNKEQDRMNAAVQSMRDELENERKLRLRSENLHRKLARELYEAKKSLVSISKELERERKSSDLLEDLCNEFARGIRDYGKELHDLRQKSDKNWGEKADHDQLILHISELWLDEQMQVKLQCWHSVGEKKPTIDRLSSEIEDFLQSKRNNKDNINGNEVPRNPIIERSSLDPIPLNVGASAPRDEDDSTGSDSNCFELKKTSKSNLKSQGKKFQENQFKEILKQKQLNKKLESSDRTRGLSTSSLQGNFEEHMAQAVSHGVSRNQVEDADQITSGQANPGEISILQKIENFYAVKDDISQQKHDSEGISGLDSDYVIDSLIRNHYSMSDSGIQPSKDYGVACSIWRSYPSPVREWTERLPPQDLDISETS